MSRSNPLEVAFAMLDLVYMKFKKLKSLQRQNKAFDIYKTEVFAVYIRSTMTLKLFSKSYSEFLTDVIRLEFGKGLLSVLRYGKYCVHVIG